MRVNKKVNIDVSIGELMGLIDFNNKMAESIPPSNYDLMSRDGITFGESVSKYKKRAEDLYEILNEVWPK